MPRGNDRPRHVGGPGGGGGLVGSRGGGEAGDGDGDGDGEGAPGGDGDGDGAPGAGGDGPAGPDGPDPAAVPGLPGEPGVSDVSDAPRDNEVPSDPSGNSVGVAHSVVGDSVVADSVVADSVIAHSVVGDSVVAHSVVGDSGVGDSVVVGAKVVGVSAARGDESSAEGARYATTAAIDAPATTVASSSALIHCQRRRVRRACSTGRRSAGVTSARSATRRGRRRDIRSGCAALKPGLHSRGGRARLRLAGGHGLQQPGPRTGQAGRNLGVAPERAAAASAGGPPNTRRPVRHSMSTRPSE